MQKKKKKKKFGYKKERDLVPLYFSDDDLWLHVVTIIWSFYGTFFL